MLVRSKVCEEGCSAQNTARNSIVTKAVPFFKILFVMSYYFSSCDDVFETKKLTGKTESRSTCMLSVEIVEIILLSFEL